MVRLMTQKEGRLEAGDWRQEWQAPVTVQVQGDVGLTKPRPGRGLGMRNAHEIRAVYPEETWYSEEEGGAGCISER